MDFKSLVLSGLFLVASLGLATLTLAQGNGPGATAGPQAQAPARGRAGSAYPTRPTGDPALVERGKQLFGVNCSFCHGPDARGGEGGPNLVRSQLVLDDQGGEQIATVVENGRPDKGMPKFDLSMADIAAVAAFIHSFPLRGNETVPESAVLVGNAKAGEAFFNGAGKCSGCHSATGDLKGVGGKYDVRTLQNKLVMPSAGARGAAAQAGIPPTTVTVKSPSGETYQGRLVRIDDFSVSLVDDAGNRRTFERSGDTPLVTIHDPLQAHKDMWKAFNDDDIHNLTAYLVTLK